MSRNWKILAGLSLILAVGCAQPVPPPSPTPPPIPTPTPDPTPPPPAPVPTPPPTWVAPWATVEQVVPGMTRAALDALLAHPGAERTMDDGSVLVRWPAVDSTGAPRWMDVQVDKGVVLGRALWRR